MEGSRFVGREFTGIEQAAPGNGLGCFSNSRASDLILPKVNGSRSLVLGSRLLETNRRAYLQSGSPPAPRVLRRSRRFRSLPSTRAL
jgi:hypothetical protein